MQSPEQVRRKYRRWYDMLDEWRSRTGGTVRLQDVVERCRLADPKAKTADGYLSRVFRGIYPPPTSDKVNMAIALAFGASLDRQREFAVAASIPRLGGQAMAELWLQVANTAGLRDVLVDLAKNPALANLTADFADVADGAKTPSRHTLHEIAASAHKMNMRFGQFLDSTNPENVAVEPAVHETTPSPLDAEQLVARLAAAVGIPQADLRAAVVALQAVTQAKGGAA